MQHKIRNTSVYLNNKDLQWYYIVVTNVYASCIEVHGSDLSFIT